MLPASSIPSHVPAYALSYGAGDTTAIAVTLTLVGTTLSALGLVIEKYSHQLDGGDARLPLVSWKKNEPSRGHYFLSKWWLLGLTVFVAGHLLCWMGMAVGTQMMLSCLNVWAMVVTFIFAPLLLYEKVSGYKVCSVLLIIVGVITVIMSGPHSYRPYTTVAFKESLDNRLFLGCSAVVMLCLGMMFVRSLSSSLTAAEYTLISAVIGWYSTLSAKCSAGLIFTSWHFMDSQLELSTGIVIISMVVLAILNVHFMNMAMKIGEAVVVVPLYESLSILGQVFLGGIFFKEVDELTLTGHMYFWFGVVCVILGSIFMTGQQAPGCHRKMQT